MYLPHFFSVSQMFRMTVSSVWVLIEKKKVIFSLSFHLQQKFHFIVKFMELIVSFSDFDAFSNSRNHRKIYTFAGF